jgi:hemerythrin
MTKNGYNVGVPQDDIPWDIYVDERKVDDQHTLGFLAVPNTASFLHKLRLCRQKPPDADGHTLALREVHWNHPHLDTLVIATNWIDCLFSHRGARFYICPWPRGQTKELIVLKFLSRFCAVKRLHPPYNVCVILDFDSDHAKARIQNTIRVSGKISRCFHFDSENNDCIQCCDLLLGAATHLREHQTVRLDYQTLKTRWKNDERLKGSEVKKLVAGHLASHVDADGSRVYDFQSRRNARKLRESQGDSS